MSGLFGNVYRGRRVLVTGHTGFKGAWLTLWLDALGAKVTGVALPPNHDGPDLFTTALVEESTDTHLVDIRDREKLFEVFTRNAPELVFHLAAQSLVRHSYVDPVGTYDTNVMGTVNVLEACRRINSVRAVVVVTSDKCYENREWAWGYRESDGLGGHDPYSSSKACAELVTSTYRRSFLSDDVAVASARVGNVIGGGDWARDRLIPDFIRAAVRNETLLIRNPTSTRPWQHVLEPLGGYLLLGQRLWECGAIAADAWNFGPELDDVVQVRTLVSWALSHWKGDLTVDMEGAPGPHEARQLHLDCSKARAELGWKPVLPLREGLEWTIRWYRDFLTHEHQARKLTNGQIEEYGHRLERESLEGEINAGR